MQKITICPPRYAYGYRPAARYMGTQDLRTRAINEYQRREQWAEKAMDYIINN